FDDGGAVGQTRALLVHDLYLVALEHDDVDELRRVLPAPVLDDEEARLDDFEHEAVFRNRARRAPHVEFFRVAPHAEVYAVALDGGRESRERGGREREAAPEGERSARLFGREEGERDFRRIAFLASQ